MNIKILGAGCKKCLALENNVALAGKNTGINVEIEKVTDVVEIAAYGVMSTPGLILNGTVLSSGRVLTALEIEKILRDAL